MAHAVLGAAVAAAGGNDAVTGLITAAGTEAMAPVLSQWLYEKDAKDLTADEKATVSAIAGLAGAATGAAIGGSMTDVAQGNQAGHIAVDNNTVLGDKIRSLIEDAKEYWHTEKEAKDHLDVIRNIAVNTLGDGLDGVVGITDYSIDSLNAVVYCLGVTPDLCNQMHATLDPKNEVVLNTFKAAFDSRTYVQFYELVNRAAHGDLQAREAAGEMLAGILIAKKLGNVSKARKGTTGNNLSHLTTEQQQLIKNAETISTAKPGTQVTKPRDLNEQILWKQVQENPASGSKLQGMNNDPRFPAEVGFQKMQETHKLSDGSSITIHYQYNSNTGKAYDIKIITPQRVMAPPNDVINSIKDKTK